MVAMLWRRRKLLRTAFFAAAVLGAVTIGLWVSRREARYVPGERSDGLIDTLARKLPPDRPRVEFTDVSRTAGVDFDHAPFARTNQLPEDMGSGVALGDFDGDGWCDAYLVNSSGPFTDLAGGFAKSSATSRLYRNRGDGTFEDVTEKAGVGLKALGHAAAWVDVDSDGDLDLFVTTFGTCHLFRNDGREAGSSGRVCHFTDISAASGVGARTGFWTSIAAGDYDKDGRVDLFVCGYVQYDEKRAGADVRARQYDAAIPVRLNPSAFKPEPKLLFHNVSKNPDDAKFEEVAAKAGVTNPSGRGLGATFADLDGDG